MVDVPSKGAVRDVLEYNLNKYAISLLIGSVEILFFRHPLAEIYC